MVLCAYCIEPERERELREMGVKDSKLLSAQKREELAAQLRKMGEYVLRPISAAELTSLMQRNVSLNDIEARAASGALEELASRKAILRAFVDSPDPIAKKFEWRIRKHCSHSFEISCEHKADLNYAVVGAASILAKVERDAAIAAIKSALSKAGIAEDFGSGYSHDALTVGFLKKYLRHPEIQEFVRHDWATAKRLRFEQVDLSKFI